MEQKYQNKPELTLTQLEDEPLSGFFGCTFTEVKAAMWSGIRLTIAVTILLTLLINWALALAVSVFPGIWWFYRKIKRASALRADHPAFFHVHVSTCRSANFIQPAFLYQIWRNGHASKKTHQRH